MTDLITAESAALLVQKNQKDVLAVVAEAKTGEDDLEALKIIACAEYAKKKPRSGILEACGFTTDEHLAELEEANAKAAAEAEAAKELAAKKEADAPKGEKKEIVETLSALTPFSMVHVPMGEGITSKHYFQNNKIFDRATKEIRLDLMKQEGLIKDED